MNQIIVLRWISFRRFKKNLDFVPKLWDFSQIDMTQVSQVLSGADFSLKVFVIPPPGCRRKFPATSYRQICTSEYRASWIIFAYYDSFCHQKGSSFTENHRLLWHTVCMTLVSIPKGVILSGRLCSSNESENVTWFNEMTRFTRVAQLWL